MKDEVYLKMLGAAVWESPVPIYVIHVEVDEAGKPVDWRFAYANEAEAKHLSIPLEKLLGRSGIELLPKIGGKWLFPYYEAAYHGKTLDFDTLPRGRSASSISISCRQGHRATALRRSKTSTRCFVRRRSRELLWSRRSVILLGRMRSCSRSA